MLFGFSVNHVFPKDRIVFSQLQAIGIVATILLREAQRGAFLNYLHLPRQRSRCFAISLSLAKRIFLQARDYR